MSACYFHLQTLEKKIEKQQKEIDSLNKKIDYLTTQLGFATLSESKLKEFYDTVNEEIDYKDYWEDN